MLTSRADPPLPLARLRGRGQLAELRAADLRFTQAETAAFLREATGLDLPPASVAKLQNRTEGWAVGVQLAALSLQGHPTRQVSWRHSLAAIGGNSGLPDTGGAGPLARQLVGFLLETAILERLSGGLCDAVTRRNDSQQVLEQVEQANLFVVPLDEVRGWWRYHHLFADLLRARLEHTRPERPSWAAPRPPGLRCTGSPTTRCGTPGRWRRRLGDPAGRTERGGVAATQPGRRQLGRWCPRFRRSRSAPGRGCWPCPGGPP